MSNSMTKRQQRIFLLFLDGLECLTSQKLSLLLNISKKTIQNDIKILNQMIKDFAEIQSIPSKGYQLRIYNDELLNQFQETFHHEWSDFVPSNPLERAYYILGLMLKNQDFIKIDDLSDLLYIERTSISRSVKIMRECLEVYGLEIIQKTGRGLKIIGNEFRYRQCMAEYIYHKPDILVTKIGKNQKFMNALKELIFNDGMTMPERVFQNFVIHIQVQLDRIENHCFIDFRQNEIENIENEYEYLVAKDVTQLIKKYFGIDFNRKETAYLAIHIIGKKSNSTSAIESCINNQLKKEIDDIVQNMLERVNHVFHVDLHLDMYLRKAVGIHIHPMENRLKFNTYLRNPLIDFIKEKYLLAYMMSLEAWKAIALHNNYVNIEDEIGYIAIHFQYALERRKRNLSKKRVLLVNDYSIAISELLSFSILKTYRDLLVIENTISASELDNYNLLDYDCLITTVPIITQSHIPIIKVNPISTEKDLEILKEYLHFHIPYSLKDFIKSEDIYYINVESKEEVYGYIYHQEKEIQEIELSHQILIHYVRDNDNSHIVIYVLNKPILWKNKFIKVIIVLYIHMHSEEMIECIQRFLSDQRNIDMLIQSSNQQEIINYILQEKNTEQ